MTLTEPLDVSTRTIPWNRIAGAGAITFAIVVGIANVVVPQAPAWDASGGEVATWVHDHHTVLALSVSGFAVSTVALLVFAAGLMRAARESADNDVSVFATIGLLGMIMIAALFGTVEMSRLTMLALDGAASSTPALVEFAWHIEGAAFILNTVAIGVALVGVTGAAVRLGWAPRWYTPLSIAGLLCGVAATIQAPAVVNGANGWQIGLLTFISWIVLLLVTGTRMARQS